MDSPMISVIIPVYNAEKTMARCIDSVLEQTYQDFEILLIDDGSTDGGGVICRTYVDKDHRIRYIKKENGGVSTARNRGIDEAQGKYITFIDSDDWIENDALSALLRAAVKYDADLVSPRCRGVFFTATGEFEKYVFDKDDFIKVVKDNDLQKEFDNLLKASLLYSVCGRLFRRSFLLDNKIRFNPECKVLEDFCFTLNCLSVMSTFAHINKITYNYVVINDGSYQFKRNSLAFLSSIDYVYNSFFSFLMGKEIIVKKEYYDFILNNWIIAINNAFHDRKSPRKIIKEILNMIDKEDIISNCTQEKVPTEYHILFKTKRIHLFLLVKRAKAMRKILKRS